MQFTVCSRGRPIGTTDLGFLPLHATARMGWFWPNEEGERLMPVVSAAPYALSAWGQIARAEVPDEEASRVAEADLAEALHHVGALELTIHREDGTRLDVIDIGIRDRDAVAAAFGHGPDDEGDASSDEPQPAIEIHLDDLPEEEAQSIIAMLAESDSAWAEEALEHPGRYQIVVTLADGEWIPR